MLASSLEVDLRTPRVFLVLVTAATACTATHRTRTVGQGHAAVEVSLGGPITTALGPPVPMPVFFLGGRYGIRDDLDVSLAYNVTAPAVPSIPLHLETGVHYAPIQPGLMDQPADQGWSLVTNAEIVWLSDFEGGLMVFPTLGVTGAYRYKFIAPYIGTMAGANFYRPFERTNWFTLTPHVGLELMAGPHFGINLEAAFMDATNNFYGSGLEWVYLADNEDKKKERMVLMPMIGFTWDFDTRPDIGGGDE